MKRTKVPNVVKNEVLERILSFIDHYLSLLMMTKLGFRHRLVFQLSGSTEWYGFYTKPTWKFVFGSLGLRILKTMNFYIMGMWPLTFQKYTITTFSPCILLSVHKCALSTCCEPGIIKRKIYTWHTQRYQTSCLCVALSNIARDPGLQSAQLLSFTSHDRRAQLLTWWALNGVPSVACGRNTCTLNCTICPSSSANTLVLREIYIVGSPRNI